MTATHTNESTLEHLDFEFVQPCEHSNHAKHAGNQPAAMLIHPVRVCCRVPVNDFFLCLPGWERAGRLGLRCRLCGKYPLLRDEAWKIVRFINA